MSRAIDLPEQVSPDGKEIWDWAGRFSRFVHLKDDARNLSKQIREIQQECGSCGFWMTSKCPRETPTMRGYNSGPSCSAPKCSQFVMKESHTALLADWQQKLIATNSAIAEMEAK